MCLMFDLGVCGTRVLCPNSRLLVCTDVIVSNFFLKSKRSYVCVYQKQTTRGDLTHIQPAKKTGRINSD